MALSYYCAMPRVAKIKNGFAPKTCVRCGLEFEWRKKWAKNPVKSRLPSGRAHPR